IKIGVVYVNFGLDNPVRYRLMFGSALTPSPDAGSAWLETAAGGASAILGEVIHRGAQAGIFAASPRKKEDVQLAVLAAWSVVHGLTMLTLDGLAETVAPKISKCGGEGGASGGSRSVPKQRQAPRTSHEKD
ncbi:MAG TPA: TetR-like C-terminal domain-containing protein, partial [Terriglobales bacterium]|nr:TetR-like C-terminal domain-containing protein [Terriglobales bacterium]